MRSYSHDLSPNPHTSEKIDTVAITALEVGVLGLQRSLEAVDMPPPSTAVHTASGAELRYTTYEDGDGRYETLTSNTVKRRTRRYVLNGIWVSEDVEDPVRGKGVEFVTLSDGLTTPIASLRKIHIDDSAGAIRELPSFIKFTEAGTFSTDAMASFYHLGAEYDFVEIAALFSDGNREATDALFGRALGDSIVRGEVWFMGVVPRLYFDLRHHYGEKVVQTIGDATPVKDGLADDSITIYPVIVEPARLPARMLEDIEEALKTDNAEVANRRKTKLRAVMKQFDFDWDQYFGQEISARLREIENE